MMSDRSNANKPWLAALYSGLVLPGFGQFYNSRKTKGLVFLTVEILALAMVMGGLYGLLVGYLLRPEITGFLEEPSRPFLPGWMIGPLWLWITLLLTNRIVSTLEAYMDCKKLTSAEVPNAERIDGD